MKPILFIATFVFSSLLLANSFVGKSAYEFGDFATAFKELQAPAKQGDLEAMYLLGHINQNLNAILNFSLSSLMFLP